MTFPTPMLSEALEELERGVHILTRQLPKPLYLGQAPHGEFRYPVRTSQVIQILKAVRVVSGLHGALHLIRVGHYQEAAVILRVVHEAIQDIDVLDEAHHSSAGATSSQQQLVDEFFASDDARRLSELLAGKVQPVPRVARRKKRAALERRLSGVPSPVPVRPMIEAVEAVLDGYAHGGYAQIMEMYIASDNREGFVMRGVNDPTRAALFVTWFSQFVFHALNSVAEVLRDAKCGSDAERLAAVRGKLEASPEYQG